MNTRNSVMESFENLWSSGVVVVTTLEEAYRVIDEYEKKKICKFIVLRVDKGFGAKGQSQVIVFLFSLFLP